MNVAVAFLALALVSGQDPRPKLGVSTAEKFDAKSIPAYEGEHEAVYRHILGGGRAPTPRTSTWW